MRIIPILLAALLVSVAILPGLTSSQSDELTLRVVMQDDMSGLNPLTVGDIWSWNVLGYIYDGTIRLDPDTDEPMPYIAVGSANVSGKAESWADCAIGNFGYIPQDLWQDPAKQEAIIFYDFTNVKWHDGHQMDIRDVMFSMHLAAQVPEWSSRMDPLKADNFTSTGWLEVYNVWESQDGMQAALRFRVQEPYAGFFRKTISPLLLPEHIWAYKVSGQAVDGAKIWCDSGYDRNSTASWQVAAAQSYSNNPPIGNGPFKFDFREVGQFIKLLTNRDHFFRDDYKYKTYVGTDEYGRSDARQPLIEAITYKIYKTADAAVLALKIGDIDYIAWSIPPSFIQDLGTYPGIETIHTPMPGFHYLAYNMRRPSFGYNEAGEDVGKAFRQAVAHCIDKNRIVSKLLLNLGVAGNGPVSPYNILWYNESVPQNDFDPQKAKQILADAGYKVKKSDGTIVTGQAAIDSAGPNNWWMNPDGSNIGSSSDGKIDILFPEANYDPISAQSEMMIAEQMRTIGIYTQSIAMDFGSIVDRADNRDFDMYGLRWYLEDEPADYLHSLFHSSQADMGYNYPGYRNDSFDSVIDLARSTGDYETKRKAVFEAQASICYDLPYDVLYYKTNIEAYRSDRFIGWEAGDAGSIFNYMSLLNIHPPGPYSVVADFITPPSAMASNSTVPITVVVRDQDGNPLAGANVKLNATRGALSADVAVTDSAGRITVNFTAPYVPVPGAGDSNYHLIMDYGISAIIQIVTATYVSNIGTVYDPAPQKITEIRVFPEDAVFLSVSITADPDFLIVYHPAAVPCTRSRSGAEFTYAMVEVRDQDGLIVANATVAMTASPIGLTVEPAEERTDAEGKASFRLSVGDFQLFDNSLAEFTITAVATDSSNPNITAANSMPIYVMSGFRSTPPPEEPGLPVAEVAISLIAIFVAAVAYAVFIRRKRQ